MKFVPDYKNILTLIQDNIIVADREGVILYINYVLPQYRIEEVIGSRIYDYVEPKHHKIIQKAYTHTWNTGKESTYSIRYTHESGILIWYDTRLTACRSKGKTEYIVQSARDMTKSHMIQEELMKNKEELEQSVKTRTQELELKNLALKEILSQIEKEKQLLKENVVANCETELLPLVSRLKSILPASAGSVADLLISRIQNISSGFGTKISDPLKKLTPSEIQVCNLIRSGLKSKEIGRILKCSNLTVDTHRTKIRKKLGLTHSMVNLETYLQNLK